jgi:hypothetical protein
VSFSRAPHSAGLTNNKNKNMKVIKKKATAPVIKSVAKTAEAPAPAVAKRTVSRDKVLREYTVAELEKLVGRDTKVGVSFKSLKAAVVSLRSADILKDLA